jgi:SnoaL-like protein
VILDSLTAGDRVQLLEVYSRSVMLLELDRCEEWADLFSPQAVVRCTSAREQAPLEFKGRDELLVLGRRLMLGEFDVAVGRLAPPLRCRHLISNITLFGAEARHALGYGFLTVTTIGGREPPRWLASGRYSDRLYRCSAGCWRFESRTYIPDSPGPAVVDTNQALTGLLRGARHDRKPR